MLAARRSPLVVALQGVRRPIRVGTEPPRGMLAEMLNQKSIEQSRIGGREDFRIHVSSLIKVEKPWAFCPREQTINYFESRERQPRGLTPGFKLLFKMGHAIHALICESFRDSRYGDAMWGRWTCRCGRLDFQGQRPDFRSRCRICRQPADQYHEYHLEVLKYRLVAHPDMLLKWGKRYYLYEFKTIDRKDVDFATLTAPLGDHVLQASFYFWVMKWLGFDVSPMIRYVYVDRSTTKLFTMGGSNPVYKEFTVKTSPSERIKPFVGKAQQVMTAIETRVLPPKICDSINCTRAKNCSVAISCFERRSNRVSLPQAA